MSHSFDDNLKLIHTSGIASLLKASKTGLEKESLRVSSDGYISQLDHPTKLGSPLTHPEITTDYGEALLELITPPCSRSIDAFEYLLDIETFVYRNIDNEWLWTTSMPCVINSRDDIRIAEYGSSNDGKMKHIYRHGLAWRYGKTMQVIAGIHFNYSLVPEFWKPWQQANKDTLPIQIFINEQYMGMIRNLQRFGWLIPYLFGSSPAICKSFLGNKPKPDNMEVFNQYTYYEPGGTSLRMGDIGYTNRKEHKVGIKANYNSLQAYIDSLEYAISTPCPEYEEIGIKVGEAYRQLNANLLQIENEYYSTVRPKQILQGYERPVDALRKRGIQYVELRSLDINPFHPAGMSRKQLYFLEIFMLYCLFEESPDITSSERKSIDDNQSRVAHQGRLPKITLIKHTEGHSNRIELKVWAETILEKMSHIADLLDELHETNCYRLSLQSQVDLIHNPQNTPSAQMLDELYNHNESFFEFAQRKSEEHRHFFLNRLLADEKQNYFEQLAVKSLQKQKSLEATDQQEFDIFLNKYFNSSL